MENIVLCDGSTGLLGDGSAAETSIVVPSASIVTMEAMQIHQLPASACIDRIHRDVAMECGSATAGHRWMQCMQGM
jgi:hypothetical protein